MIQFSRILEHIDGISSGKKLRNGLIPVKDSAKYDNLTIDERASLTIAASFDSIDYLFFRQFEDGRSSQVAACVIDNTDEHLSEHALSEEHHRLWMYGSIPLIYVVWPTRIDILSCIREPIFWNKQTNSVQYSPEKKLVLEDITISSEISTELERFSFNRLADGTFWEHELNKPLFDRKQTAHELLIQAVEETDKYLEGEKKPELRRLLILFILIKYLEDRGVFPGEGWFGRFCKGARNFHDIVTGNNTQEVHNFLSFLEGKFNGDIFAFNRIEEELNLDFEKKAKDEVVSLGSVKFTNSWLGFDDPVAELSDVQIKISKDRFLLTETSSSGESSIEFAAPHDSLTISPDLLKRLEKSVDNPKDSVKGYKNPRYMLNQMQFADMHPTLLCQLFDITTLIDSSEWDQAEESITTLKGKAEEADDAFIKIRCDKIKQLIANHKKQTVPIQLSGAKKIGVILEPPVYPPLDTPTIFWQDTLLCVLQTDTTHKKPMMRTWNPSTAKWGPIVPARIPKCSMKGYFNVYPCYYCENESHYWHSTLELPGEQGSCDLCDCFTDDRPLVSIPSQKVFLFKKDGFDSAMIALSGGSCIAGHGEYLFNGDGKVYSIDMKISWDIQLGNIVNSSAYEFVKDGSSTASYPVVVSANQNFIAYAIQRDNNSKIELWVARISYNVNNSSKWLKSI